MFFTSLIELEYWNRAKWKGVAYVVPYEGNLTPFMVLIYDKIETGRDIFTKWRNTISPKDPNNELRISIVEGDAPNQPKGYFVHVSQNIHNTMRRITEEYSHTKMDLIMTMTRIHRMPTKDFKNLNMFKEAFKKTGNYFLVPGGIFIDPKKGRGFKIYEELKIEKSNIELRNYEDIKEKNDYDAVLKEEFVNKYDF